MNLENIFNKNKVEALQGRYLTLTDIEPVLKKMNTNTNKSNPSLLQKDMMKEALLESFVKLNPKTMFKNPVMFTVEIGTFVMLIVCIWILLGENSQGSFAYNFIVFLVLLLLLYYKFP